MMDKGGSDKIRQWLAKSVDFGEDSINFDEVLANTARYGQLR